MFEPRYTITSKLLANIKRIATLTVQLNHRSIPGLVVADLERRAVTLSAHTSTRIEGNPLPLTEVRRLLKSQPKNLRESEREVVNYNDALEVLNRLVGEGAPALTLRSILDIQGTVVAGLMESYHCGRLRAEPVVVNDPRSGEPVYLPPDHVDVEPLMRELVDYVVEDPDGVDPLILAGLFHKQFVIIHPFVDGNGRTARLVTKLLLAAMGLNTFPLFSFENFYNRNISRYFALVGVSGSYYELRGAIDFSAWLEYFTEGIVDELMRVLGDLETVSASPESTLREHHEKILAHIKEHGYITDRAYARLTDRAKATRALDFRKLMELRLIERHGKGRSTYYKFSR